MLAQSIMRKPILASIEIQVDENDIDEETNPFRHHENESNRPPSKPQHQHKKGRGAGHFERLGSNASHAHSSMPASPMQSAHHPMPGSPMQVSTHRPHGRHGHGHGYGGHDVDMPEDSRILQLKVSLLHLLHKMVGLDQKQMCFMLSQQLQSLTQAELCRVFIVEEASKELEPFCYEDHQNERRISVNDSSEKSIAGETLRRKQYMYVQNLSASSFFNPAVDLGPVAGTQKKWQHGNLVSLPIASNSGYLEMIIMLGRVSSAFTLEEIESISWMAVTLGNVVHHNKHLSTRESQIHLMDGVAENAVLLARKGCEVQDPRFWMRAFDAQVAQIALVHREPNGRFFLYCNCSDTSKEEVSMTCYPLR
jgi:hypothetical protein